MTTKSPSVPCREIVIWKNHPAIHDDRIFQTFTNDYAVHLICDTPTPDSRLKSCGWTGGSSVDTICLADQKNAKRFVKEYIGEHSRAIHLLCGLRGCRAVRWALPILLKSKTARLAVTMEAPTKTTGLRRALQDLIYRRLIRRCRHRVDALFAMGKMGVRAYERLGFPAEKIHSTMYGYPGSYPDLAEPAAVSPPLKTVYVGEAIPAKGVHLLLESLKSFSADEIQLTMIGNDPLGMAARALQDPALYGKVRSLGIVPNQRIIEILSQQDLLVLPSLNDGWGMVVTEALIAGIGAVVTNACGSQDIPAAFDTGLVIPAGSLNRLRGALKFAVENPQEVLRWKQNAVQKRDFTRPEKTAESILAVLKSLE